MRSFLGHVDLPPAISLVVQPVFRKTGTSPAPFTRMEGVGVWLKSGIYIGGRVMVATCRFVKRLAVLLLASIACKPPRRQGAADLGLIT